MFDFDTPWLEPVQFVILAVLLFVVIGVCLSKKSAGKENQRLTQENIRLAEEGEAARQSNEELRNIYDETAANRDKLVLDNEKLEAEKELQEARNKAQEEKIRRGELIIEDQKAKIETQRQRILIQRVNNDNLEERLRRQGARNNALEDALLRSFTWRDVRIISENEEFNQGVLTSVIDLMRVHPMSFEFEQQGGSRPFSESDSHDSGFGSSSDSVVVFPNRRHESF